MATTGCVVSHSISLIVQHDALPGTKPGMRLVWGVATRAAVVVIAAFMYWQTCERDDPIEDFRLKTQTYTDKCKDTGDVRGRRLNSLCCQANGSDQVLVWWASHRSLKGTSSVLRSVIKIHIQYVRLIFRLLTVCWGRLWGTMVLDLCPCAGLWSKSNWTPTPFTFWVEGLLVDSFSH